MPDGSTAGTHLHSSIHPLEGTWGERGGVNNPGQIVEGEGRGGPARVTPPFSVALPLSLPHAHADAMSAAQCKHERQGHQSAAAL